MNTINTESLTISLTALAVIANRLMDNNDKELFSNDARIIMAENPTQDYLKGISKGLYPNDHKRAKAFELSTFHCQWLDSNGSRATKFAEFLNDNLTLNQIRILSTDALGDFKAQWRASTNKPQAPIVQAPSIVYGEAVVAEAVVAEAVVAEVSHNPKVAMDVELGEESQARVDASLNSLTRYMSLPELRVLARELNSYVDLNA
jgi:hypothetical protein